MRIVVIVACSLSRHALHEAALAFVGAARAARHNVVGVYLLQDGVELALAADKQGEHLRAEWSRLVEAAQPDAPMAMGACVGALGRRQASDADVMSEPAASGFEPVGLGQIIAALLTADRVVEFRA